MKEFLIKKIEFTLFEVCIPDIGADPSGFGVWYEPGPWNSTETVCREDFHR